MTDYRVEFEYEGKPCGHGVVQPEFEGAGRCDPEGCVFVCPVCAHAWAKHTVAGRYYMVYSRRCRQHDSGLYHDFAGSVWVDWNHAAIEGYSREVLEREMEYHLDRWEKHNGNE